MKAAVVALLALGACGGGAPPAPPTSNVATPAAPAARPPYAGLFDPVGVAREFTATLSVATDGDPVKSTGTVTCATMDVAKTSDGATTRLACGSNNLEIPSGPDGIFAMRPDGLWALSDLPEDDPDEKLMDVVPVAGEVKQPARREPPPVEGEGDEVDLGAVESSVTNEAFEGGWCITSYYSMRRESGSWTLCLDDGAIVGGKVSHVGFGSSEDVSFGRVP